MTVLTLDGVDDRVTTALGSLGFAFGPGTMAAIFRKANDAAGGHVVFWVGISGISARYGLLVNGTQPQSQIAATAQAAPAGMTITAAEGWVLLAVTKVTGTAAPRFHKYTFATNTWTHGDSANTSANSGVPTSQANIGSTNTPSSFFAGDLAIAGVSNTVLTDAQVEALVVLRSAWDTAGFVALWRNPETTPVQDTIGAADQTAITGTTTTATEPPWTGLVPIVRTLTPATTTDQAQRLSVLSRQPLAPASTVDQAQPLHVSSRVGIQPAATTDEAQPLSYDVLTPPPDLGEPGAPGMRIYLTDQYGAPLGEVADARARSVSRGRNRLRTARFAVDSGHPLRDHLRRAGTTIVKVYDAANDNALIHTGEITGVQIRGGEDGTVTYAIGSTGGWRLAKRMIRHPTGAPMFTASRAQIIRWVLLAMNGDPVTAAVEIEDHLGLPGVGSEYLFGGTYGGDTGVRERDFADTPTAMFGGWTFLPASQLLALAAAGLDGIEWHIYPCEPTADAYGTATGLMDVAPIIGQDRSAEVLFEYGAGLANVATYEQVIDAMTLANSLDHLPPGFPDGVSPVVHREDPTAWPDYNRLEALVSADITDVALREQLLDDHLAVRSHPRQVLTFETVDDLNPQSSEPALRVGPRPGIDYDTGDILAFRAWDRIPVLDDVGRVIGETTELAVDGTFRLYALEISDDDDGRRHVSHTVVADTP